MDSTRLHERVSGFQGKGESGGVETDAEVKTFSTRVITALLNEDKYKIKYGRLKDRKGESTSVYKKEKKKHLHYLQIQAGNLQ